MTRIKPRGRYLAISVPIELHKEITDYVKKSSYNSVAEFVKFAVREKIERDTHGGVTRLAKEDINLIANTVVGTLAYGYQKIKKKK